MLYFFIEELSCVCYSAYFPCISSWNNYTNSQLKNKQINKNKTFILLHVILHFLFCLFSYPNINPPSPHTSSYLSSSCPKDMGCSLPYLRNFVSTRRGKHHSRNTCGQVPFPLPSLQHAASHVVETILRFSPLYFLASLFEIRTQFCLWPGPFWLCLLPSRSLYEAPVPQPLPLSSKFLCSFLSVYPCPTVPSSSRNISIQTSASANPSAVASSCTQQKFSTVLLP